MVKVKELSNKSRPFSKQELDILHYFLEFYLGDRVPLEERSNDTTLLSKKKEGGGPARPGSL